MIKSITQEAIDLHKIAHAGPIGKRHSSFDLYELLAKCYALAERVREPSDYIELQNLIRQQPCTGKGRWTLDSSDNYLLVCRYVFPRMTTRRGELSNASRYASCLREAHKSRVRPHELADYLRNNGGINALFLRRPLTSTTVKTKILHLAQQIEIRKDSAFTITLQRRPDNTYEVLSCE